MSSQPTVFESDDDKRYDVSYRDELKEKGFDVVTIRDEVGYGVLVSVPGAVPVRVGAELAEQFESELGRAHRLASKLERRQHLRKVSVDEAMLMNKHGIEQRLDEKWGFRLQCKRDACTNLVTDHCYCADTLEAAVENVTTRRAVYYCGTDCWLASEQWANDKAWEALIEHAEYHSSAFARALPGIVKQALAHDSDKPPAWPWLADPLAKIDEHEKPLSAAHEGRAFLEWDLREIVREIFQEEVSNWDGDDETDAGECDCDA